MLPNDVRVLIYATRTLHVLHPQRRAAFKAARVAYAGAVERRRVEIEKRRSDG